MNYIVFKYYFIYFDFVFMCDAVRISVSHYLHSLEYFPYRADTAFCTYLDGYGFHVQQVLEKVVGIKFFGSVSLSPTFLIGLVALHGREISGKITRIIFEIMSHRHV